MDILPANINQDQVIRKSGLPEPYRVIRPMEGYTEDYISNRLNVNVDDNNRITSIFFG
jgi:excinuclease UvrABC helicase subunit UvrB